MCRVSRVSIGLLIILSVSTLLSAQEQRGLVGPTLSPLITAATAGEKVRFSSPAGIAQIRVQIISATGDPLFDSAWKDGNLLDWPIESPGQPLANGSYRCVVMVKDLDGQVTRKEAVLTAEGGQVSIEPRAGNEGLTIVGAGESGPKITLLAHDEKLGAIVNTSGDLSFRFGEFFAGRDSEKMRLTAAGSLGIGTDQPQAPLDVNGLIRTSKGIMFPDGTILTTAGGEAATGQSGGVNRLTPGMVVGAAPGSQTSATASRLTPHPAAVAAQFVVDGAGVHIGTTNAYGLDVAGNVTLSSNLALPATTGATGVITLGGSRFAHNFGSYNTFLGANAGNLAMSGPGANTAIGVSALTSNISGDSNTAIGSYTLLNNSAGSDNTAIGSGALLSNTGDSNTATGVSALRNNTTGYDNTATGYSALRNNTGAANTASGYYALYNNTTGIGNIAIGDQAGANLTTGNNNIDIGSGGLAGESLTIRIGAGGVQTRTFIAGIRNLTTDNANAIAVLIDSNGQLGTINSSRRYKFDIASMGDATEDLMRLRPVTFRYLAHGDNAPPQYGLIAEEVAEVYPQLVARNKDGEVETVLYHFLAPMLLNEVQKLHRQNEEQQKTIDALNKTLDTLGQRLQALERQTARSN